MIDTIRAQVLWPLLPAIRTSLQRDGFCETGQWFFRTENHKCEQRGIRLRFSGYNQTLGIRVSGEDFAIRHIQASLPRVLHGYNGRLIKAPAELQCSQELLFEHLREISASTEPIIEFTRVDLVLNLPGDPKRFVLAHRNARHPRVRRADVEYGESSIRFPGTKFVFQLYWKQKERADKAGLDLPPLSNSIRAELQLKGKETVRRVLGGSDSEAPVTHLDFFHCYRCFETLGASLTEPPTFRMRNALSSI